ncbi:MAG: phage holin family protein [Rubrobacteraceae bacterium]
MEQRQRLMEAEREPSDRSIKEIVDALRPQLQELSQKQVELAKLELTPVAKKAGLAGGLLSVGGVFLHLFVVFISVAGIYLLNEVGGLSLWASALIVSGILLVIGLVLAGAGANILRKLDPKPHHTIRAFQQNVEWIKEQFRS